MIFDLDGHLSCEWRKMPTKEEGNVTIIPDPKSSHAAYILGVRTVIYCVIVVEYLFTLIASYSTLKCRRGKVV